MYQQRIVRQVLSLELKVVSLVVTFTLLFVASAGHSVRVFVFSHSPAELFLVLSVWFEHFELFLQLEHF